MKYFRCINCDAEISTDAQGTNHRNHCPFCLWSRHLDINAGDRLAYCEGAMKPICLAFKDVEINPKTGHETGELMVVHECVKCGTISANRIAGDDDPDMILRVFKDSLHSEAVRERTKELGIRTLTDEDHDEMKIVLFGYDHKLAD